MEFTAITDVLISLGLGLLVGLQREWSKSEIGGIRTFALITMLGSVAGLLADVHGGWIAAVGIAALAAMIVMANLARFKRGSVSPGMTTEMTALLMFLVGVAVSSGYVGVAVVATGSAAFLLQWKAELHGFVQRVQGADLRAAAQLALIGLVVLPALPNRSMGPYGVLNPFHVWLMVVLIVGISLGAYAGYRLIGPRAGTVLAGLLGGLISSTATTVTYAHKARQAPAHAAAAAVVIVTAGSIVFVRVLFEIAVVTPRIFFDVAPPLIAMLTLTAVLAVISHWRFQQAPPPADRQPPSSLRTALAFGLLYALILLASAAAQDHFGSAGLYAVAGLSGLMDMDAITLSTVRLIDAGQIESHLGWRLILVASMANLVFKGAMAAAIGGRALAQPVAAYFGIALAGGAALLAAWS